MGLGRPRATFANNSVVRLSGSVSSRLLNDPNGGASLPPELSHSFGSEQANCGIGFHGRYEEYDPDQPELALGALGESGEVPPNPDTADAARTASRSRAGE